MYPVKRVFRDWRLFAVLLIGVALAATFFAGVGVKMDVNITQSLDKQLSSITTDMTFSADFNRTNMPRVMGDILDIDGVKSVDTVARYWRVPISFTDVDGDVSTTSVQMVSFPNSSRVYDEWLNKPVDGIPKNVVYIVPGTQLAGKVAVNDTIVVRIDFPQPKYGNSTSFDANFTVAGFANLTDVGYSYSVGVNWIALGDGSVSSYSSSGFRDDLIIIGWDSTLMNLWSRTLDSSTVPVTYCIDVDRQNLISTYNIEASVTKIRQIADNIQSHVLGKYYSYGYVNNMLGSTLESYNYGFQNILLNFMLVSLPIFFAAWYLGHTVSAVSFNIRRREIGLLSTKGLSSGQIQRIFLGEAFVIGTLGGFLGIIGGLILNQYYAGTVDLHKLFSSTMLNPTIIIATMIFAIILSITSVYWSSRKASRIPAVDALRNYMPPRNRTRKIFPIIALILGSYKIVIFMLGVNVSQLLYQWNYSYGNLFLTYISNGINIFDSIMTYFGPLLFFWGFTALLIRDSTKFQTVATKISSVMGELGALAARNVRRNPERLAAVAFLVALIVGLSVQVTVQIASQEDFIERDVHRQVGADIKVTVVNASRSQELFDNIAQLIPGIRNASIERSLTTSSINNRYSYLSIQIIEPAKWAASAYYEDSWFTGGPSLDQMLSDLTANSNTIILDRNTAQKYDLKIGDQITINFNSCPRQLKIVGFFGNERPDNAISDGSIFSSYVPSGLFNLTAGSDLYPLEPSMSANILLSLEPGVDGIAIANQIRDLHLEIYNVVSFDEQWQLSTEMNNLNTYNELQILDLQNFGLIFAVLSASVGTALIAIVSLKERSREATLMSVRGLSYRQLVWMFLLETLAIITFAVILGIIVGLIIGYGNIVTSNTAISTYSIVLHRLIFPPNAVAVIGTYVTLIYASTIGAILIMTSQYVTKLEKMVRTR
ncbi:MAG: FtsX-like permease family protein [Nitrososphaerota archaeon]|jgi:ABC-type lipoprotein release transport system permease subunit|nr:FtsX-like permease family protein [Nitrososphaerota archaeon]